jgi:8-oxo-dGTP diphosphatase
MRYPLELLKEITEEDIGLKPCKADSYRLRRTSRAVVLDPKGKVVLMYSPKMNLFWTPGGGIEEGESAEDALRREVLEEVGCRVRIDCGVGVNIEYENSYGFLGISFCFLAHTVGRFKKPELTEFEASAGAVPEWRENISDAIMAIRGNQTSKHGELFAKESDTAFLEKAKSILAHRRD